ncbi:FAD-dependent oxidoreductase [Sphingosinicella sp.]|uniref:FAD-dependent oxidoreductase n=1 Tax=Sphingosinicella sp. TaxID=1917971 RepID=UPI004037FA8A
MAEPTQTIIATRGAQMFPTLTCAEVARLRRFGETRAFEAGEILARTGDTGHGLTLFLSGEVEISQRDGGGTKRPIVTHGPGSFMGELAQLSGGPSFIDAVALKAGEAVDIPPDRLRALLIAEAELGERIMRALILRRVGLIETGGGGPVIVGRDGDGDVLRLVNFLTRNGQPHQRFDPDRDSCARTLIERFQVEAEELPIVLCPGGQLLRNPTEGALARCIGLVGPIDPDRLFDLVVIGAGPAGLATSVYAGSEGLSVLTLDCRSFGGQAGASSRIENYLGFPTGISGMALMGRAFSQAQKFGVEMAIPDEAVKLECGDNPFHLALATGERVKARTAVIATGARYRRLDVPGLEAFEGATVHYWASPLEAQLCAREEVALVGGGNSAGQAVVFLAGHAARVHLIVRKPLVATMSAYLVERIEGLPNVEVVEGAEISALEGEGEQLAAVRWRALASGVETRAEVRQLFSFIGAEPNTDWLAASGLKTDARGFVCTGADAGEDRLPLETSRRGVFAVGDVRAGSVKRVAASVGDGAQVVAAIHAHFAAMPAEQPVPRRVEAV